MDTILEFGNSLKICTSSDVSNVTEYVIREQGDWFEGEIHFIRSMLRPGSTAIDIGANHGVYTLSMARAVGPEGAVHAFEPASGTATCLRRSVEVNGFGNIRVNQVALSDTASIARLYKPEGSELNSLVNDGGEDVDFEDVATTSLDAYVEACGLHKIDFIKLDAEGHEMQVLTGASRVLRDFSPLIMLEVAHGAAVNLSPALKLRDLGYGFFTHIPGLNIIAPIKIDGDAPITSLNVFACKPDKAKWLLHNGFLADNSSIQPGKPLPSVSKDDLWSTQLQRHPYGKRLEHLWRAQLARNDHRSTVYALALYARSQNTEIGATERYTALLGSLGLLTALARRQPSFLRSFSLARVAIAAGERAVALDTLHGLWEAMRRGETISPIEPFLAPEAWFDDVDPGDKLGNWICAATMHTIEKYAGFSSIYSVSASLERLGLMEQFGFVSPEMERRGRLLKERFPPSP